MTMEQGFDPRSITVLVVDDEPRLVDVLRLDLEIEGLTTTAPESLQAICEHVVGALVARARIPH